MSKTPEEQPSVQVRRQSSLPAYLKDYDLSGFHRASEPSTNPSNPVQQKERESEEEEGAIGGERSASPISQEDFPSSQWTVKDEWPPKNESHHRSGRQKQGVEKDDLHKELEELKLQNARLRYRNEHSQLKLEQLSRQSSSDTHQLRKQVEHLSSLVYGVIFVPQY